MKVLLFVTVTTQRTASLNNDDVATGKGIKYNPVSNKLTVGKLSTGNC